MMKIRRRWWMWLGALLVWTALLLAPLDAAPISFAQSPQWRFTITTLAHVIGYAVLTGTAAWLPGGNLANASGSHGSAVRIVLLYVLSAHAVLSELLQPWFERTGCLEDAALDLLGILLGMLVARRYWFGN